MIYYSFTTYFIDNYIAIAITIVKSNNYSSLPISSYYSNSSIIERYSYTSFVLYKGMVVS